jgi:uncharacterized protein (TIGR02145 family)
MLKSTSGWNSNGNGTDAFGFSALPAGFRYGGGGYSYEGNGAYFWSSTESTLYIAYYMKLYYDYDDAILSKESKHQGFSVRCLRD